jgi:hypothetical protein
MKSVETTRETEREDALGQKLLRKGTSNTPSRGMPGFLRSVNTSLIIAGAMQGNY